MKKLLILSFFAFSVESFAQTDLPLFAKLIEIKSSSEFELSNYLTKKELAVAVLDVAARAKARQDNYDKSVACMKAYMKLKSESDKLILQLKADMTLSNKVKHLRKLQKGRAEMSWYNGQIDAINERYTELINCINGDSKFAAASLGDITGVFTAIAGIFTGARDARAEKVKSLCSQLDTLRMNDISALGKPAEKEDSEK